jgi:hypothetical protein
VRKLNQSDSFVCGTCWLQESEAWCLDVYVAALAKGERLSAEETESVAAGLSRYTVRTSPKYPPMWCLLAVASIGTVSSGTVSSGTVSLGTNSLIGVRTDSDV